MSIKFDLEKSIVTRDGHVVRVMSDEEKEMLGIVRGLAARVVEVCEAMQIQIEQLEARIKQLEKEKFE